MSHFVFRSTTWILCNLYINVTDIILQHIGHSNTLTLTGSHAWTKLSQPMKFTNYFSTNFLFPRFKPRSLQNNISVNVKFDAQCCKALCRLLCKHSDSIVFSPSEALKIRYTQGNIFSYCYVYVSKHYNFI